LIVLALIAVSFTLVSCGKNKKTSGQLIGAQDRPTWKGINPFGMVFIPPGSLTIGAADQDLRNTYLQRPKTISISGFYMDDTEITNNEYRQFVEWVRDSIAHVMLDDYTEDEHGNQLIDWDLPIDLNDEALADLYYQGDDVYNGRMKDLNVSKMIYNWEYFDLPAAAQDRGKSTRNKFIKKKVTNIYPDTLVWVRDFAYSFNEPMAYDYFWHPAFDDYPVVGVTWDQANAFCHWRTQLWLKYRPDENVGSGFRLPIESEWEYAARGGFELAPYPWGGYGLRNSKGCLLANFKPGRGNYPEDGGYYTVRADAYFPNEYGLFNMAGNVSEWTITAFAENAYSFYHDQNPDFRYDAEADDPISYKRKVIRGGSWKDIAYFLRTDTRHWEYQDSSKSYIGFRCVLPQLGKANYNF
jgi:gliding motility-associated lipoprotein GldK